MTVDPTDILTAKAGDSDAGKDLPPPPVCPPGREPKWNGEKWECVDIVPPGGTDLPTEQPSGSEVKEAPPEPAIDPRKQLQDAAKEFAAACNYAVDHGISIMEVMTIAQQTLIGLQT